MHIAILYNRDHEQLEDDPGREAREDVTRVASALCEALSADGVQVDLVAVTGTRMDFLDELARMQPDLVINLCESMAADSRAESLIPGLLDVLGLPYTGSAALTLTLALHKDKAKELLKARGVSTPGFARVDRVEDLDHVTLPFPLIVKPTREDASVGITSASVVHDRAGLRLAVETVLNTLHQPALVEQFIAGREIYVPMLGNAPRRVLPLSEIRFGRFFDDRPNIVTYAAKWEAGSPDYANTASGPCLVMDSELEQRLVKTAMEAFAALECRDYGRVDMRVTPEGVPYVIDINPNCDLHPEAGFAKAAASGGMDYRTLARQLVEIALERHHGHPTARRKGPGASRVPDSSNRNLLPGRAGLRDRARRSRASAE
ncbi:MAG: ATP-grasp domain-containing protein [Cystobacter sp.]